MSESRRERRERARELAREIMHQGNRRTGQLDLALWFLAAAMAVILFLVPKVGRPVTVICLLAIIGFLAHPVFQLPWISGAPSSKSKRYRYALCMALVLASVGLLGFYVWPEPRPTQENLPTSAIVVNSFQVVPVSFEANKPFFINVIYRNDAAYNLQATVSWMVFVDKSVPNDLDAEIKLQEEHWTKDLSRFGETKPFNIAAKTTEYMTLRGGVLPQDYADALNRGEAGGRAIHFMGYFRYSDSTGTHQLDFCHVTRGVPIVIFNCADHNGPVKPMPPSGSQ